MAIDDTTVKTWSAPFRGWHYHPDHVIPANPNIKGFEKVHMTDVPTVFQIPGDKKWYMTFIGFDGKGYQSFVAESDDLVNWSNRRLAMGFGKEGEFDFGGRVLGAFLYQDYNIKAPRTLKKKDGKYWSLYGAYPKQGGYELEPGYEGVASSEDGITWQRAQEKPIMSIFQKDCAAWEKVCIYQPWLVEHEGTFYNMYNAKGKDEQLGLAFSKDLLTWKRYEKNPVIPVGGSGSYNDHFSADGKIFRDGDHWTCFFFGVGKGSAHIMIAFSRDLLHWTVDPEPLYKGGGNPSGLDKNYAHKISLVWNPENETYYMFYNAVGSKGRGIGLITSKPITNLKQNTLHDKVLLQGALSPDPSTTVSCAAAVEAAIDRQAVVSRHNITVNSFEKVSPLSVGNGRFTFTCDVTGLQTFPALYRGGIPLTTMAEWGWHSVPKKPGEAFENTLVELDTQGRKVSYPLHSGAAGGSYFRANPHQSNLAQLGFALKKAEGTPAEPADLTDCQQTLNLWTGIIESRFKVAGEAVHVETFCHPRADLIVVQVTTELIRTGRLALALQFPYASGAWGPDPSDWTHADAHTTTIAARTPHSSQLRRTMDAFTYHCFLNYSQTAELRERGAHAFLLTPSGETNTFQFCMALTPKGEAPALELSNSKADCTDFWKRFWSTGGAIDLSASTDSRWRELERRIILSRYLTAIQSAQRYPPQETGLTGNSWYGKFHLEMHWWHSVHFAVWDKPELLERSLAWYRERLPVARAIAERQGYAGVRWPKMVGPDGVESPSAVGPLLIWQQPHPIYLAELIYRSRPTRETLEIYEEVVSETARFMADYAHWNEERKCFELGPPLIPAREHAYIKESAKTKNPTYELANWVWSLRTANLWRERLGKPRNEAWERIAKNMAPAPMHNGVYVEADPFIQHGGHPTMLAAYGVLPETGLLDHAVMRQTLHHVMKSWDWDSTWGWDYPMIAMTAARLGEAEMALDALLKDVKKNLYLVNGHNYQTPGLPLYLPGNGGLLAAVAMMAGGWEGCPARPAPGFPHNGKWVVKYEGLKKMP